MYAARHHELFSPKLAFSAGLPSRIATGQLDGFFDFHAQPGLLNDEQAVARAHDIGRTHTSMRILGYELDRGKEMMTKDVVPFWRVDVGPVQRLEGLVALLHGEVDRLAPCLRERTVGTELEERTTLWKEGVLRELVTNIVPAVNGLAERVSRQVADVVLTDGLALRL
ncbi:hypothetical protein B0A55_05310 [Friedmanniomyces simplex]|uniref:Uncharacterized protein n=1 Tax=Friedmanniomyces simplex TaxID=329884 RepID=A0A4U0X8R1_9PEZI|nr:hypothetical protein B0A55_05310 [Friedmanniomyces simplex]